VRAQSEEGEATRRYASKLAAVWEDLTRIIEQHTGEKCGPEPLDTLSELLAQQAHAGADEERRQAFAEVGEKMRANVRPDELARFVDSEILKPRRPAIRAAQEGGSHENR